MRTSTAYDFSAFAPEPQQPEKKVRVVHTSDPRKKEDRRFAAKLTAYAVVIVLLMTATVYSRLKLTETKSEINSRTSDLTELQSQNAYLNYQLESLVSLKNAENYAVNQLGLVKMDSNRIEYMNLQDKNEIVAEQGSEPFGEKVETFFNAVIDFCGG